MNEDSRYLNFDNNSELEKAVTKYIKDKVYSYLYKVSKEFNSDIDGFGKYAVKHFATWDTWESYNWLNNYNTSFFNVDVETNVKSGYILMET